jgi:16S rRNA (guanine966-N2)-methyltransferase
MLSTKKIEYTELRIIGGAFRGKKLEVPVCPGLRPTNNRIRETLFNWLQPLILDSHCLDAFAGSGALGFEALSRGAVHSVFIENNPTQAQGIEKNAKKLQTQTTIIQSAWPGVKLPNKKFDIVFLDPPFNSGLIDVAWNELLSQNLLADNCWIYLEHSTNEKPTIPASFDSYRSKQTKQVVYSLYTRSTRME